MVSLEELLNYIGAVVGEIRTTLPAILRDVEEIAMHLVLFLIFFFGLWKLVETVWRAHHR